MGVRHTKVSDVPENTADAPGIVGPNDWNADHAIDIKVADLSDVDDDSPGVNDTLIWDGSKYVPGPAQTSKMFTFMGF